MSQSETYTMDTTEASSPTLSRDFKVISNHSLDFGSSGEDIAYPNALIECLLRSPSQLYVRNGGSQQKLTANFAFSGKHKLKFDVNYEARQSSQLFNPDRFRCFW